MNSFIHCYYNRLLAEKHLSKKVKHRGFIFVNTCHSHSAELSDAGKFWKLIHRSFLNPLWLRMKLCILLRRREKLIRNESLESLNNSGVNLQTALECELFKFFGDPTARILEWGILISDHRGFSEDASSWDLNVEMWYQFICCCIISTLVLEFLCPKGLSKEPKGDWLEQEKKEHYKFR